MAQIKFRWHRGSLKESMETMVEDTPENIVKMISKKFPGTITCDFYATDNRIGWRSYLVLVNGAPVGFSNHNLVPELCGHCKNLTYRTGGYCSKTCDKYAVCYECGSSENISIGQDPYRSEIGGDDTENWQCSGCRSKSAEEI